MGLIGIARGSESPALRDEAQTDGDLIYVGTYTDGGRSDGIYLIRMDRRSGTLRRVGSGEPRGNPPLAAIPPQGRGVYARHELEKEHGRAPGAVGAFPVPTRNGPR